MGDQGNHFEWTKELQNNIRNHLQNQVKRNKEMRKLERTLDLQHESSVFMKEDLSVAGNDHTLHEKDDDTFANINESMSQLQKEKNKRSNLSKILGGKTLFYL